MELLEGKVNSLKNFTSHLNNLLTEGYAEFDSEKQVAFFIKFLDFMNLKEEDLKIFQFFAMDVDGGDVEYCSISGRMREKFTAHDYSGFYICFDNFTSSSEDMSEKTRLNRSDDWDIYELNFEEFFAENPLG